MSRKIILFVIVAVIAGRVSVCLNSSGGVARGQTTTSGVVLQDNFDDNKTATMWKKFGTMTGAAVTETNKRLEFTASPNVSVPFIGYLGDKWWVDPNQDFQMRIDLYFDANSYNSGWICFGLTSNPNGPSENYVTLGVGCSGLLQNYWREWNDGAITRMDFESRFLSGVTLYLSYDSWYDILYLSDSGYGEKGSWQTMSKFIKGTWGRVPIYVFLAATTDEMTITSGHAYLDNFVIEKGKIGTPYSNVDPGGDDPDPTTDITATVSIVPSVIKRKATNDRIIAVIGLPQGVCLSDWDSKNMPVMSPGSIKADSQTAFVWADNTVKILASFSKTALMSAITADGQATVYVAGKLKDGSNYAGSYKITIE